jgi:hypothetical protein
LRVDAWTPTHLGKFSSTLALEENKENNKDKDKDKDTKKHTPTTHPVRAGSLRLSYLKDLSFDI